MDAVTLAFSIAAAISGWVGTAFAIRAFRYTKNAPVRAKQAAIQDDLRVCVRRQGRLVRATRELETRLPSVQPLESDLHELRNALISYKSRLVAPTPRQMDSVIGSVDRAIAAWDDMADVPTDDSPFDDVADKAKRDHVRDVFMVAVKKLECLAVGLEKIDSEVLSTRKQIKLFKSLDGNLAID